MSISVVACGSSDSANQINDVAEQDNTNDSRQSVEDAIIGDWSYKYVRYDKASNHAKHNCINILTFHEGGSANGKTLCLDDDQDVASWSSEWEVVDYDTVIVKMLSMGSESINTYSYSSDESFYYLSDLEHEDVIYQKEK